MTACRVLPALALALALAPVEAMAADAVAPGPGFYFAPGESVPALANDYLRSHPGEGLKIVTVAARSQIPEADARQEYFSLQSTKRSPRGVCRFIITQIFAHPMQTGGVLWDTAPDNARDYNQPPYAMAAPAAATCPPQDNAAYVMLDPDVTDAEFLDLGAYWKVVSPAPATFDASAGYLDLILSPSAAKYFADFRMRVLAAGPGQPQLRAVLRHMGQGFDLGFGDGPEATSAFLTVSKTVGGYSMVNFQTYRR